ncbi:hypothetical protein KA344_01470 [bacterium]|jgi:hypothetical protein|nr:hypothetical protein [bacterium]
MNNRFIRRSSSMPAIAMARIATTAIALTALSSTLSLPAWAQSDSSSSSTNSSSSTSDSASSGSSNSSSNSTASTSPNNSIDTATDATTSASGSGGVLWTAPQYQVKSVGRKPSAGAMPPDIAPGQGSAANAAASTADGSASTSTVSSTDDTATPVRRKKRKRADAGVYDESAAKAFSQAVSSEPQYVWLSPDRPSPASQSKFQQNRVLASSEQLNRLDSYIKDLSQAIQTNVAVPGSAQLVETANRKYSYLVSFVVKNSGQISNITTEKQVGTLTSVPLADDEENSQVEKAITRALGKVSPVKVPPAGFAPWYMLLKYDLSSGNVFVACLNAK